MYAIIQTGGKQYKVAVGETVKVEKLDAEVGAKVALETLMVIKDGVFTNGGTVEGEVIAQGKGKKLHIFRYKAKKNVRRKIGHRQPFTAVKITSVK